MWKGTATFASLVFFAAAAFADCSVRMAGRSPAPGSDVCLYTNNYPEDMHILAAADRWNNACDGGEAIPSLNVGGCNGSSIVIQVVYDPGISTNFRKTCGAGLTDAGELESLTTAGITLLDTSYKRSNKTDAYGNLFRFRSKAMVLNPAGHIRSTLTYDVYFVESPPAW